MNNSPLEELEKPVSPKGEDKSDSIAASRQRHTTKLLESFEANRSVKQNKSD